MLFKNHSLLRSGGNIGGKKKRLPSLGSGQQRLAVNVIVGLKCKCPFPLYDLLQEIEVSFKLPFAWV